MSSITARRAALASSATEAPLRRSPRRGARARAFLAEFREAAWSGATGDLRVGLWDHSYSYCVFVHIVMPFLRLFDTFKLLCEFRGGGRRVAAGCTVSVCKSAHVRLLLTQRLCYMSARRDGEQNQGEGSFISNTGWGRYDGAFKGERPTQVTK